VALIGPTVPLPGSVAGHERRSVRVTGTRRILILLGAACLAVAAQGCGGDDKGINKADYLARAKTVCQKGNRKLTAASNDVFSKVPPGQKLSDEQIDDFVRTTVIPTIRDQIKELRALPPPKGEKGHVEEIYKALDKGLDELQKNPKKLTDGSNVFADADTLANKYGITVCAQTTG
jgi:hypothetical protein